MGHIRAAIRATRADIVFLQEVLGHHERWARKLGAAWPVAGQLEALADSEWPHFAYGRNALYAHGHHGNAILSRYPIRESENLDVSQHRIERRGILACAISVPAVGTVYCYCVHFGLLAHWRLRQARRLCEIVEGGSADDAPIIIAGDFNDWRERLSPLLTARLKVYDAGQFLMRANRATYPLSLPVFNLDRIYCRGAQPLEVRVLRDASWQGLSDHAAVLAVLEFRRGRRDDAPGELPLANGGSPLISAD